MKFQVGNIVKWNKVSDDYGVHCGAQARVTSIEGSYMMEIEWIKDYNNIELVNGQMDGNYFQNDFELMGNN